MGRNLGSYELRGELGRGAMAVVWRAWDPVLDREVAIKEPLIPAGMDPHMSSEFAERFVREGKAAASLNHVGIITIYTAGVYDGRPAIVMESIDGETLAGVLDRGALEPASAVAVLDQLLDAVAYAHQRGVVHRDIKPDNVFITRDGGVKLADFGIAQLGSSATLTQAGTVMGTPGYMAPEQVLGLPADARVDIFAIGVLGYEMLAGRNPFGATEGLPSTSVMYQIVHEEPRELSSGATSTIPVDIGRVLAVAMAKQPDARFPSADRMRAALHGGPILSGGSTARIQTPGGNPTAATSAGPSAKVWVAVALAALVSLVVVAMLFSMTSPPSPSTGASTLPAPTTAASDPVLGGSSDAPVGTGDAAPPPATADGAFDVRTATKVPSGMSPEQMLKAYGDDILASRYADAYKLLPLDKQQSYEDAAAYEAQVRAYGITGFNRGKPAASGDKMTIVNEQVTPQMPITYTWTFKKVGGQWYVESRTMGGSLQ